MKPQYFLLMVAMMYASVGPTHGQILNRIKNKIDNKIEEKVDDKIDEAFGIKKKTSESAPNDNSSSESSKSNTGGAGLISTPPDVNQNLSDAENSFKSSNYGEARYALQQAMLGVEMEIGQQILKSLPDAISGLNKDESADQVTSTGWGWAGLTIARTYTGGDKEFKVTIANNSVWMSAVNMYFTNAGYSQTTGGEQDWKQTKVQGNRAIIEFDESSGYKLSVPVGQTSIVVYEGVNFATETDMMNAAEAIKIDDIKARLGEQ